MFLSTFEKQLDAKRRIVVPQEFRALAAGPFDGVFCFPSIEADCIEGGGKALFDRYAGRDRGAGFGDPLAQRAGDLGARRHGQAVVRHRRPHHPAGDPLRMFGLTDWVAVVGLGDRFQIWARDAFQAHRADPARGRSARRACA